MIETHAQSIALADQASTGRRMSIDVALKRERFELAASCSSDAGVLGLLGRSGSGKSTLLHMIAGLVAPDDGRIAIDRRVLFDRARGINIAPHLRGVAVVFQDDRLLPHKTVAANLSYGARRAGAAAESAFDRDRVIEALELAPLLGARPADLSGGERKRVEIGRALLSRPRVLLLDEPFAGLDQRLIARIDPLLRAAVERHGMRIIHVSHNMADVLRFTDQAMLLRAGRLIACGSIAKVIAGDEAFEAAHEVGLVNVLRCRRSCAEQSKSASLVALRVVASSPGAPGAPGVSGADGTPQAELFVSAAAINSHDRGEPDELDPGSDIVIDIAVRPADIALARSRVEHTSIQNQILGRVISVRSHPRSTIVHMDIGQPLLVEVSDRAVQQLGLAAGGSAWCLIKTNALRVAGRGGYTIGP